MGLVSPCPGPKTSSAPPRFVSSILTVHGKWGALDAMVGVDVREQSSSNWLSLRWDEGSLHSSHFYASWTSADRQNHAVPCVAVQSCAEVSASNCKHGDQDCGESDLAFTSLLNALFPTAIRSGAVEECIRGFSLFNFVEITYQVKLN